MVRKGILVFLILVSISVLTIFFVSKEREITNFPSEGEHIIALKFQPQSYKWGRTITLSTGGLMLITVAIVWLMRPRLQGETSDEDTAV